jgi:hypothetical protein
MRYPGCRNPEYPRAEFPYSECRYAECPSTGTVILKVVAEC